MEFYNNEQVHAIYLSNEYNVSPKTIINWYNYYNIKITESLCKCGCGKVRSPRSLYLSGHNPPSDWNNDPVKKTAATKKASTTKKANYKPAHNRRYSPGKDILYKLWIKDEQSVNYISGKFNVAHFVVKRWLKEHNLLQERNVSQSDTMKRGYKIGRYKSSFSNPSFQSKIQSERKSYNRSKAEIEVFDFINNNTDNEVLHSYKVNNINIDIFIPSLNVGVEYNGLFWHSEAVYYIMKKRSVSFMKNYHKYKTTKAKEVGITLIHIFEDDWSNNQDVMKRWLLSILNLNNYTSIYGRKCFVSEIPMYSAKQLLIENHIQGHVNSSVNIGLFYDNKLLSCMTFIKGKYYNLSRYVVKYNYHIHGGFAKMLKFFTRNYDFDVVSFADLSWVNTDNNVYERNGFKVDSILSPDYKYIYDGERSHKFNFRHSGLKKKLPYYNPELTEYQNCLNHEIYRIWDSGKIKYKLINH